LPRSFKTRGRSCHGRWGKRALYRSLQWARAAELLVASGIAIGSTIAANAAEARWYIAHMGAEACVPVDDIGDNNERLYYGAGNMRTPDDFARQMTELGAIVKRVPSSSEDIVTVIARKPGEIHFFNFFHDLDKCKFAMSHIER
jgi:hypothetical protein